MLLVRVETIPANLRTIRSENGRRILAKGEATGHHHSVPAQSTSLLAGPNNEMYLLVREGEALLEHQEHAPIRLVPGNWRVIRQREFAPETPRLSTFVRD